MPTPLPSKRVDEPRGRYYEIDGGRYPSVTTILSVIAKPALVGWAAREERALCVQAAADLYEALAGLAQPMPRDAYIGSLEARIGSVRAYRRQLQRAGAIGTEAHARIEWTLRRALGLEAGPEPKLSEPAQWAYMAWEDWARSVALEPVAIETVVYSRTHGYAGTADLVARVNGTLTLLDWKTGRAVYPEAHMQNVAYRVAWQEMGFEATGEGLIVRLPKQPDDPAFEVVRAWPVESTWPAFEAALRLWRWWANVEING